MNRQRLLEVADRIEQKPDHFDMCTFFAGPTYSNQWGSAPEKDQTLLPQLVTAIGCDILADVCGTTACVAGWAMILHRDEVDHHRSFPVNGADILGLDPEEASWLFYDLDGEAHQVAQAIRVLADQGLGAAKEWWEEAT